MIHLPRRVASDLGGEVAREGFSEINAENRISGQMHYLEFLAELHAIVRPRAYLEIGVRDGDSIALADCPAVGIDPMPSISRALPPCTSIVSATSDEFFARGPVVPKLDLAFIDGMHLLEFALRDFRGVEGLANKGTIVVVDDIFPNVAVQGSRHRKTRVWMGDIWKLPILLSVERPDLDLTLVDTSPSGLLLIRDLEPGSRVLQRRYRRIVRQWVRPGAEVPDSVLSRMGAVAPATVLEHLRKAEN